MSYKGASSQAAHEEQISSGGSHEMFRSRASAQKGGSGATTGYHAEDSGSAHGSSIHSSMQRNFRGAESGAQGSNPMARYRVGSELPASGHTATGPSVSFSDVVSRRQIDRHGGSSIDRHGGSSIDKHGGSSIDRHGGSSIDRHGGSSTMEQSRSYGSSSAVSNRASSGGHTGVSGGLSGSSGASGQRLGVSGSSSSVSRGGSGSYSGGFSSRSTGGFSSRSTGGRQGYSSGGCGGFNLGSSGCVPSGGYSFGSQGGEGLLKAGEKETMQNLNSRLSAYMDKVAALEDSNEELEEKIRNWYETNKPRDVDNSKYYKTIEDLNDQISDATKDYNQLTVEVENARLAADDFRGKYEMELNMRQEVEMDIEELRKALDDLTLEKASLEGQVEDLTEEIALNKKNHEEAMKALRGQKSDVVVQVDAAPGINILKVLNDIRSQYEDMAEENRRKAEEEYNQKLADLNNEISYSSAEVENGKAELAELRRTVQTMEIDLQSQLAMKCSLENALAETQIRYARQLAQIQQMVSNLEEQLAQVRSEMENESCRYNQLLDIKTRLENEIEMYRSLVDKEGGSSSGPASSSARGSSSGSGSGSARGSSSVSASATTSSSSSTSRRGFSSGTTSGSGSGYSSGTTSGSSSGFSSGSTIGSGSGFSSGSTSGSGSGATKGSSSGFSSGSTSGSGSGFSSGATKGSSSGFSSGSSSGIASGSNGSSYGSSGVERRSDSPSVPEPAKRRLVTTLTEERVDRRVVTTMGPKKA